MSETTKVRIGLASARELEFEMDEAANVTKAIEEALQNGDTVLWLTDARGLRHGVIVEKVAFVEIEKPEQRDIGFG